MFQNIEKKLNNWIVDFVIGGSYLSDSGTRFFEKIKKIGREAYDHIMIQFERVKKRYRS
ncbi:MAG: hypothetical protein NTY80_01360 [candidate division SR1 bacterium]|nr:hypothetical protein [candidate division SR1 bacterium]